MAMEPVDPDRLHPAVRFDTKQHPLVYHYCSTAAFISIITTKHIWLSDYRRMNDSDEIEWMRRIFDNVFDRLRGDLSPYFTRECENWWDREKRVIIPVLASFSLHRDALSQWRAYADDGHGFAIGFNTKSLSIMASSLGKICYDPQEAMICVENIIIDSAKKCNGYRFSMESFGDSPAAGPYFQSSYMKDISLNAPFFKNPAFIEEDEVRLVNFFGESQSKRGSALHGHNGVDFRVGRRGAIVPYEELLIKDYPNEDLNYSNMIPGISSVIVGPKSDNTPLDVRMMLANNGFYGVPVIPSAATYR